MDENGWDALFGMTDADATAGEAVSEAAPPPDEQASLVAEATTDPVSDTPVAESVAPDADATPVVAEPASEPEPAQVFDWREDPDAKAALAEAEQFRQIKAQLAEAQRLQRQQQFQKQLADLADGDSERMQQITGLLAQATTPIQQQYVQTEQRATTAEKTATAMLIAMQAALSDEQRQQVLAEMDALMTVEGPDAMERLAFGKRDAFKQYQTELGAKDALIADLQRQLAARAELNARQASGADAVDGGNGAAADLDRFTRMEKATSNDEFFGAFFSAA